MNTEIQMHDIVALLEDMTAEHFTTGTPLTLRRGQIGTVVMTYDGTAFEIEFSDALGRTYAMLPVSIHNLIVLHDAPTAVAA